jgi:hypothetical protein
LWGGSADLEEDADKPVHDGDERPHQSKVVVVVVLGTVVEVEPGTTVVVVEVVVVEVVVVEVPPSERAK